MNTSHDKSDNGESSNSSEDKFANLYTEIMMCLKDRTAKEKHQKYLKSLVNLLPELMRLSNVQQLSELLEVILALKPQRGSVVTRIALFRGLAILRLQSGQYAQAMAAFDAMYLLANKSKNFPMICEAQTGSIISDMYLNAPKYDDAKISDLLANQRTCILSADMLNRLNQALAFIQYYWNKVDGGIIMAKEAYNYWKKQENNIEAGRTAYILALLHRSQHDYDEAAEQLETAELALRDTEYAWQYATVANEYGSLSLYREKYDEAVHWHQTALAELNKVSTMRSELRIMLTHICLGTAYVFQRKSLDLAQHHYEQAFEIAQNPDYAFGIYHIYHGFGFTQFMRGNRELALEYLNHGRDLTQKLDESPFRSNMMELYDGLILNVENNCDPSTVLPYPPNKSQRSGSTR